MKRYLKYILLSLVAATLAVSCLEELEPTPSLTANDEVAVLVPRVKSFMNQYVTKSDYNEVEITLTSLKVLVFNKGGKLIHHQDVPVESRTISLNKSMLNSPDNGDLSSATVVMLANMDLARLKKGDTPLSNNLSTLQLDDLENYSYSHEQTVYTSLESGFKGFPMIGGTTGVDLSPTSSTSQQAPVVVDLKILYAKVNFEISVDQDGENQRVDPSDTKQMQFQLDKYAVYNASKVTALAIPTNEGEPVHDFLGNVPDERDIAGADEATLSSDYAYTSGAGANLNINKTVTLGGEPILFTFYIAESRYNHNLTLEELRGIYPDSGWVTSAQNDDVKGWENLSAEEKKLPQNKLNNVKYLYDDLIQQYKPKLADVAGASPDKGKATFVRLTGTYTDYRGTSWTVNYTVYLGKDNAQNFHIDRNSEYTNYISIKGVRNADTYGEEQVWFDHRVDVSLRSGQGADNSVTITRETLLDAHIEVRPLRFKFIEGEYDRVNLYLPTDPKTNQLWNWIGIEKFTGANCQDESIYCFDKNKVSTGKRKYFTAGLIKELQEAGGELGVKTDDQGKKYLDFHEGYTAWIYFDENKSTSSRDAVIRLEFYKDDEFEVAEEYTIRQSGLQKIKGTDYIVESFEEYLHSYDSADKYNLSTSPLDYTQQGLPWGLEDKPISKDIIVSAAPIVHMPVIGYPQEMIEQRYDYFHKSDVPSGNTYYQYIKDGNSWIDIAYGTGLTFTDRASSNEDITIKDMGTVPVNAYQYCLSKNKFDEENNTLDIHWYLPDPHELKAVLAASHGIADFGSEAHYWSSQPSKRGSGLDNIPGLENINIINEVISDAIAVSSKGPSDISRTQQNRIRCFYSEAGIKDVNIRVPDGLDGNNSFIMKGKPNDGYFNYIVDAIEESDDKGEKPSPTFEDYAYPTFSNPGEGDPSPFGYFNNEIDESGRVVEGFAKYPLDSENWAPYDKWEIIATNTYYKQLYVFPGLSPYTLVYDGQTGARPSGTERSKTITTSTIFEKKQSSELENITMNPLSPRLEIRFDSNLNTSNEPQFVYSEITDDSFETTEVHKWSVPTYTKSSYTPKPDIDYVRGLTVTGTGTVNGFAWNGDTSKAEEDAKKQALENAKNQASRQFPNRKYEPAEGYQLTVKGSWNWSGTKYTATATFKGDIECATSPDPVPYYADARNGGWNLSSTNTVSLAKVETDELRIYPGNSFTITCTDPNYEITKVRINYKDGTNVLHEPTGLGDMSMHTSRFIDSDRVRDMPITNSADVIGMEYDESKQWQQWTGLGRQVVSLTLVDYQLIPNLDINISNIGEILELIGKFIAGDWGAITSYDISYQIPRNYLDTYMVVESIDVKCVKKKTTEESTE